MRPPAADISLPHLAFVPSSSLVFGRKAEASPKALEKL